MDAVTFTITVAYGSEDDRRYSAMYATGARLELTHTEPSIAGRYMCVSMVHRFYDPENPEGVFQFSKVSLGMNVIEQVRQHDQWHADDASRECGDQCEFEPSALQMPANWEATADGMTRAIVASVPPDWKLCPLRVQSSLEAYVRGLPTGDFLRAVLSNDLNGAITRADDVNIHALSHIMAYVRERLPAISWGPASHVARWLETKRKERADPAADGGDPWKQNESPTHPGSTGGPQAHLPVNCPCAEHVARRLASETEREG